MNVYCWCRYPHCLHLLDLLQYEAFRKELVNVGCAKFIDDQILLQWQYNAHKKIESQQKAPPFKRGTYHVVIYIPIGSRRKDFRNYLTKLGVYTHRAHQTRYPGCLGK